MELADENLTCHVLDAVGPALVRFLAPQAGYLVSTHISAIDACVMVGAEFFG